MPGIETARERVNRPAANAECPLLPVRIPLGDRWLQLRAEINFRPQRLSRSVIASRPSGNRRPMVHMTSLGRGLCGNSRCTQLKSSPERPSPSSCFGHTIWPNLDSRIGEGHNDEMDQNEFSSLLSRNFKLFVSDLDGTLVDSEPYHLRSYELILSTLTGLDISLSYSDIVGRQGREIWSMLATRYGVSLDQLRLNRLRKVVLSGLYLMNPPEVNKRLIEMLSQFNGPKLLITTQTLDSARRLARLVDVDGEFEMFISESESKLNRILQYADNNKGAALLR